MNYTYFVPPFELIPFREMSKKEAVHFYEWYINEIPYRLDLFEKLLIENSVIEKLSFSTDLLIPIWDWYEKNICFRKLSDFEYSKK